MTTTTINAKASGSYALGGTLPVTRLGFGSMQLTGEGVWGDPKDHDQAIAVLRRAVELGVTFIDTADAYGPAVAEELIREALHPYADDLVVATKAGLARTGPGEWPPLGRPEYLRQQAFLSMRRLGVDHLDLLQLHRVDPTVPLEDQVGAFKRLQDEGYVRHIGLSEVSVAEIEQARQVADIVSVQNLFNLSNRKAEDVLDHCTQAGIAFIPWFPLATGQLAAPGGPLDAIAREHHASAPQLALAWLLHRSPVMLPIPGTSSVAHLEDNLAAAQLELSDDEVRALEAAAA